MNLINAFKTRLGGRLIWVQPHSANTGREMAAHLTEEFAIRPNTNKQRWTQNWEVPTLLSVPDVFPEKWACGGKPRTAIGNLRPTHRAWWGRRCPTCDAMYLRMSREEQAEIEDWVAPGRNIFSRENLQEFLAGN